MKAAFAALLFAGVAIAQSSSSSATESASLTDSASLTASVSAPSGTASGSATGTRSASGTNSASHAAPTGGSSAYQVPAGVSASCSAFLQRLDSDVQFTSCTSALLDATDAFGPSGTTDSKVLVSTLNTLCAAQGCSDTYIRGKLVEFDTACKTELLAGGGNKAVKDTYDILYIMNPLKKSICSKDGDTFCVLKAPSNETAPINNNQSTSAGLAVANNAVDTSSDPEKVAKAIENFKATGITYGSGLSRRAPGDAQSVVQYAPNTETYRANGVMYLYTLPSLSSASLCTPCTQAILAAYAKWESSVPYASGLANSPMLGTQGQLWTQVSNKCGAEFIQKVQAVVQPANSMSAAVVSIGAGLGSGFTAVVALAVGLFSAL